VLGGLVAELELFACVQIVPAQLAYIFVAVSE
jgi:hypothetical protein